MGENPLARRDLVAAILELRQEAERRLLANKYYVAMTKLDELLAAIRPLDIIEATTAPESPPRQQLEARPETRQAAAGDEVEPAPAEAKPQAAPQWSAANEAAPEPRSDAGEVPQPEPQAEPELGSIVEPESEPAQDIREEAEETGRPWLEPESNLRAS